MTWHRGLRNRSLPLESAIASTSACAGHTASSANRSPTGGLQIRLCGTSDRVKVLKMLCEGDGGGAKDESEEYEEWHVLPAKPDRC
jgi:hypothetical protein